MRALLGPAALAVSAAVPVVPARYGPNLAAHLRYRPSVTVFINPVDPVAVTALRFLVLGSRKAPGSHNVHPPAEAGVVRRPLGQQAVAAGTKGHRRAKTRGRGFEAGRRT